MSTAPIWTGRVTAAGQLRMDAREDFLKYLGEFAEQTVEVTVRRKRATRSLRANAWYWGVVIYYLADHTGYTADEMHEVVKSMFLPKREIAVADKNGEIVAEMQVPTSTTVLTVDEFSDYCKRIQRWAAEELGLDIPDPNE